MRIVTRNLGTFDADTLRMLPALIKTQMLRNVTRYVDVFGGGTGISPPPSSRHYTNRQHYRHNNNHPTPENVLPLLQSLLHNELLQLDLRTASGMLYGTQLLRFVRAAPNLCELKLAGAVHLSADDLLAGLSQLPQLRALQVSAVPAMDDGVVQMLAARCPALEVLDVSRCERVGDGCAETVRGMRLRKFNVAHTAVSIRRILKWMLVLSSTNIGTNNFIHFSHTRRADHRRFPASDGQQPVQRALGRD